MWGCAQGTPFPMGVVTPSDQSTDANDGMINVLGKLVSHCLADFIIRFAVMPIDSRKTSEVRHCLDIPHNDVGWHLRYSELGSQTRRERKKLRPFISPQAWTSKSPS